jgi:hypothetical protein
MDRVEKMQPRRNSENSLGGDFWDTGALGFLNGFSVKSRKGVLKYQENISKAEPAVKYRK